MKKQIANWLRGLADKLAPQELEFKVYPSDTLEHGGRKYTRSIRKSSGVVRTHKDSDAFINEHNYVLAEIKDVLAEAAKNCVSIERGHTYRGEVIIEGTLILYHEI